MKFIRPTPILDASLVSSSVPETDYAAWSSVTTYALGARVISTTTHRIYESLQASNTNHAVSDVAWWLDIGPTNRWAMFDEKIGSVTSASNSITVVLAPGRVNALALIGLDAATVDVSLVVDSVTVYEASFDTADADNTVGNWYDYFYEPIYSQTELTVTDMVDAALLTLPAYEDGELTVTLTRAGGTVSLAAMVIGLSSVIGSTEFGASVAIRDFSRKSADDFGNYQLVQRGFSKTMRARVIISTPDSDRVASLMSRHRATNCVWIGADNYGSMVVYGFIADWRITFETPAISRLEVEIEGMT